MTNTEMNLRLRRTAQAALYDEYGFKPALERINIIEGNADRTNILFKVYNHQYSFRSYKFSDGSVWVGSGTITKVS